MLKTRKKNSFKKLKLGSSKPENQGIVFSKNRETITLNLEFNIKLRYTQKSYLLRMRIKIIPDNETKNLLQQILLRNTACCDTECFCIMNQLICNGKQENCVRVYGICSFVYNFSWPINILYRQAIASEGKVNWGKKRPNICFLTIKDKAFPA